MKFNFYSKFEELKKERLDFFESFYTDLINSLKDHKIEKYDHDVYFYSKKNIDFTPFLEKINEPTFSKYFEKVGSRLSSDKTSFILELDLISDITLIKVDLSKLEDDYFRANILLIEDEDDIENLDYSKLEKIYKKLKIKSQFSCLIDQEYGLKKFINSINNLIK